MAHCLARSADSLRRGWVKRFAPWLWTIDFPRPMMASATNPEPGLLRVDLSFVTDGDLAGLIWESRDRWSHPLLAYQTERDYSDLILSFRWVSSAGVMPLDAVNGPTLTIEGEDADGQPRTWHVRLWNYATGTSDNALIRLPFDDLRGGFLLPEDADPVWVRRIDRMFISIVPQAFTGSGIPLGARVDGWVELRELRADGRCGTLAIGEAFLPEHALRICSGYDDSYNQCPERLIRQWEALGYRSVITHYVGMSHYYAVRHVGDRFEVDPGQALCGPAAAWHRALARRARDAGFELILSLSYELFDANAPASWAQRKMSGERALTGWEPPSTLLSPCHDDAMAWLQQVAAALMEILHSVGQPARFQVGEPWWWVGPDHVPCFYDTATVDRYRLAVGSDPPGLVDVHLPVDAQSLLFMDWLGEQLAKSTQALVEAARAASGAEFRSYLLFFTPQVLDSSRVELARANMPPGWAYPAFDVLQLEDYDFVTEAREAAAEAAWQHATSALSYPADRMHYFAGFVLNATSSLAHWPLIIKAADKRMVGVAETFVWAWPQVARDGLTYWQSEKEADVDPFHDVVFPLALGMDAVGGPEFQTRIALLASGFEQRNVDWAQARMRFDAGLGIRSEADLMTLVDFFRARRGQAHGFLLLDPLDHSSGRGSSVPHFSDQLIGVADGVTSVFALTKAYGAKPYQMFRRITRPDPDSLVVSVDGDALSSGWSLGTAGRIMFDTPPLEGAEIRAGFRFFVPVRFATDRLDISMNGWRSGEVPSVPIVEILEEEF